MRVKERVRECVCVCVCKRERVREREIIDHTKENMVLAKKL